MDRTEPIPLSDDERSELERLRSEVTRLREGHHEPAGGPVRRHRLRSVSAAVLLVIGVLLAPLSVASVWVSTQVTNTDAYVATVTPLIDDPAVQHALATSITTTIFDQLDVEATTEQALQAVADRTNLPPAIQDRLVGLATPISEGVQGFVADQVNSLVATEEFQSLWVQANRVAHEQLVAALTGEQDGAVQVTDGTVSVNIAPFVQLVKQRLVDRGFSVADRIPDVSASFVVLQSADLARAQRLFAALDTLGTVFPFLVLGVLATGVLLAVDRRRALVGAGLGLALSMVLLAVVLALVRSAYLGAVPPDVLPRGAAITVFDTLVRFLRTSLRTALLLGLLVALAAFLAGPSSGATRARATVRRGLDGVRGWGGGSQGLAGAGVGRAVRRARRPLQLLAATVAGLTLVFWDQPTPGVLVGIVLVLLVVLAAIEVLGSGEPSDDAAGPEVQEGQEPPDGAEPPDGGNDEPQEASRAAR